jgi:hypothetical protein
VGSSKKHCALGGLQSLRDKIIAHFDIQISGGNRPTGIDIPNCGLNLEDFVEIQTKTERLVCLLHIVATGKVVDYSMVHKKAIEASRPFWIHVANSL